jgi:UDP-2,3-diacylglucosamine hydrolase
MAAYFISDVHLGLGTREEEKAKEDRLLDFLRAISPSADCLFILGDLFDFWFEYATVIPKGFHRSLAALQEFTENGRPIHYLSGNHDFWIGDYFTNELGMQVHAEPFEVTLEGKRVYLHHGDGLAERDLGYRLIKPLLRNKWNIRLYRWLHPDLGVRLARRSSRSSRQYTSGKDYGETNGMLQFATKQFSGGVDIVIMGHRHKPAIMQVGSGTYVNLGDWITFNTYAVLNQGGITLNSWDSRAEGIGR